MRGEGDPQAGAEDGSCQAFSCTVMLGLQRPPVHTAVKLPSMGFLSASSSWGAAGAPGKQARVEACFRLGPVSGVCGGRAGHNLPHASSLRGWAAAASPVCLPH